MKAVVLTHAGGVENLQLKDIPIPQPREKEVLIRIKAISINPVDALVRSDERWVKIVLQLAEGESPIILGWDVSGVVTDIGPAVTQFKVGDEVFGMIRFIGHGKAYAEYATAPEGHLALKPGNVTHEEAAAACLCAITDWQALVTAAKIKKGDKVLIHAAAGGTGHFAVQMAKAFGAYVIGTGSAGNRDFILQLGADEFIDYKEQPFEERVTDADIVLDSIGLPGHLDRSLAALRRGGRLISLSAHFDDKALLAKIEAKEVYAHRLGVASSGQDMTEVARLMKDGQLHSHISQVFPLAEMAAAHLSVESNRTRGKIVVIP